MPSWDADPALSHRRAPRHGASGSAVVMSGGGGGGGGGASGPPYDGARSAVASRRSLRGESPPRGGYARCAKTGIRRPSCGIRPTLPSDSPTAIATVHAPKRHSGERTVRQRPERTARTGSQAPGCEFAWNGAQTCRERVRSQPGPATAAPPRGPSTRAGWSDRSTPCPLIASDPRRGRRRPVFAALDVDLDRAGLPQQKAARVPAVIADAVHGPTQLARRTARLDIESARLHGPVPWPRAPPSRRAPGRERSRARPSPGLRARFARISAIAHRNRGSSATATGAAGRREKRPSLRSTPLHREDPRPPRLPMARTTRGGCSHRRLGFAPRTGPAPPDEKRQQPPRTTRADEARAGKAGLSERRSGRSPAWP
jgi:hypothetical protein